jgi:tetratricopeptide (TPR) repeat protein
VIERARCAPWCSALGLCLTLLCRPAAADTARASDGARWTRLAAQTYLERAVAARSGGDALLAIGAYTDALRVDPTLGQAYFGLAELRQGLGDLQEAERLLGRAIAVGDSPAEALARRARLFQSQGRSALALNDLSAALELEPSLSRGEELVALYGKQRAWVPALAALRRVRAQIGASLAPKDRHELDEAVWSLETLAAEADALQLDAGEVSWVRRALRHHTHTRRPVLTDSKR